MSMQTPIRDRARGLRGPGLTTGDVADLDAKVAAASDFAQEASEAANNPNVVATGSDLRSSASKVIAAGADLLLGAASKIAIVAADLLLGAGSFILRAPQAAVDAQAAAASISGLSAQIKQPLATGKKSGWPDPFFRRFDLSSQIFLERDRWWSAAGTAAFAFTGWSRVPNPVYDGFALLKTYNAQQVNSGPVIWLDEIGAQANDTITVYTEWANGAGNPTVSQSAIFDNGTDGGTIGSAVTSINAVGGTTIVAGSAKQWLRISAVVPPGAARLALYYSTGNDPTKSAALASLWAFKGAPSAGPEAPTLGESYTDDRLAMLERRSAKVNTKREIRVGYQPFVTYKHPLGDAEMVGDAAFTSPVARVAGAYEQITEDTLFNALQYRVWASNNTTPVEWRIYLRDTVAAFNPSTVTPDASGTIAAGSFSTTDVVSTLALDKPLFGETGKYLFVLFHATDDTRINIKRWLYNASVTPARHAFPYHATAGVGWNANLTFSAPASGFGQTAIKLLLQSEELRQSGIAASGVAYSGAASGITATTAQGAIDELAGGLRLALPPKIFASEARQCNVYLDNLISCPDWRDFTFDVNCTAAQPGQQLEEAWRLTPTGPISTGSLTVSVYNKRGLPRLLASASASLFAVAADAGVGQTKKVLVIADSLGPGLASALSNLQAIDPLKLMLLGTQGGSVKHEARGGWTVDNYTSAGPTYYQFTVSGVINEPALNATEYTHNGSRYRVQTVSLSGGAGTLICSLESGGAPLASGTLTKSNTAAGDATINFSASAAAPGNPFWFNGAVDFAQYLAVNSIPTLDFVPIRLGTNDCLFSIPTGPEASMIAAINAKLDKLDILVASIKASDPGTRPIILPPDMPAFSQDAFGLNYSAGQTRDQFKQKIELWTERLYARYAGQEANRIHVASTGPALDTINCYPRAVAEPVNSRSSVMKERVNNALHYLTAGHQQEADALMAQIKHLTVSS